MPDEFSFKIEENQQLPEYKQYKAEKYDTFENLNLKQESFTTLEIQTDHLSETTKKEKDDNDLNSKEIKKMMKQSSLNQGISKVATTVTTAAVTVVASVAVISNIIIPPPEVNITTFDYGANYLEYKLSIDDLNNNYDYQITLKSGLEIIFEKEAFTDHNYERLTNLTPETEYVFSIIGFNDEEKKSVFEKTFTTYDSSYVNYLGNVYSKFNKDHFEIDFDIFVSDVNSEHKYYIGLTAGIELFDSFDVGVNNNFISSFTVYDPGQYEISVFRETNEDPVPLKSYPIELIIPDGLYFYDEYNFVETTVSIMLAGSIRGTLTSDQHYQANITETLTDGRVINTYHEIILDHNSFSIDYLKNDRFSSLSYEIVIVANDETEPANYLNKIYQSKVLSRSYESTLTFDHYTITQNSDNLATCDITLYFNPELYYRDYYKVDDGNINDSIYYDNIVTFTEVNLGNITYYYQLYDLDGNPLKTKESIQIEVKLPEGKYYYEESLMKENSEDITITGLLYGTLPSNQHYQINIVENYLDQNINKEKLTYQELIIENNSFTINYLKENTFNSLSYLIVVINDEETEPTNYLTELHHSSQLERSLTPSITYTEQLITTSHQYDDTYHVKLTFDTNLYYGAYYTFDNGVVDNVKYYDKDITLTDLVIGSYTYYYQLFDINGNSISTRQMINVEIEEKSVSDYFYLTPNPSDVIITYNDDDTCNLYFMIEFSNTSSVDLEYKISLIDPSTFLPLYEYQGTEQVGIFEHIEKTNYMLNYQIFMYDNIEGINYIYEINYTCPSGQIEYTTEIRSNYTTKTAPISVNIYSITSGDITVTIQYDDNTNEVIIVDEASVVNYLFTINPLHDNISSITISCLTNDSLTELTKLEGLLTSMNKTISGNLYITIESECEYYGI